MAKDRRGKELKRRAKLRERIKRTQNLYVVPFEGDKYRKDRWTPAVYRTELGVYEALMGLDDRLTNAEVETAFKELVVHLRRGDSPFLTEEEKHVPPPSGNVDYVIWNIRWHWGFLAEEFGPIAAADLIGILRTLLYSMKAQAWAHGSDRGYLYFLKGFLQGRQGLSHRRMILVD